MIEVPEYLLKRSQERRAALSGQAVEPTAEASEESGGGEAANTPIGKAPVPVAPIAPAPEIPIPASVEAANARLKIPFWVMPILVFLPIWAFIYVGTLEAPLSANTGILADGEEIYVRTAACATCHGGAGTGTNSGPPLVASELLATFPDEAGPISLGQHIEWVIKATEGTGLGRPYGAPEQGRLAGWFGTMPGFGTDLTPKELLEVVLYERAVLAESVSSRTLALQIEEALTSGALVLPEEWSEDITAQAILDDIQAGLAEPIELS